MRCALSAIIMALTCLTLSTAQAAGSNERESLVGLPGVLVVIEEINPEAQTDGLSVEAIQTAVELILRSSGIPVLTPSERDDALQAMSLRTSQCTQSWPYLCCKFRSSSHPASVVSP